jgi:hypothetical protein
MAHPLTAALLALHATTTAIAVQHVHLSGHKPLDEFAIEWGFQVAEYLHSRL